MSDIAQPTPEELRQLIEQDRERQRDGEHDCGGCGKCCKKNEEGQDAP